MNKTHRLPLASVLAQTEIRTTRLGAGIFGEYTLAVVCSQADPAPLSPTYDLKMNSLATAGQQSNIVFKRNY